MDGHPDRAALVGQGARHGLTNPPSRVGRKLVALAVVELLGGANEADRALLDQIEKRQPLVAVVLRNRDDEAQVGLDHVLLCALVALLDALGEFDLLRRSQQRHTPDVLEKQLQRIGRDFASREVERRASLVCRLRSNDLHVRRIESAIDVLDLRVGQVELVERASQILVRDSASLFSLRQKRPRSFAFANQLIHAVALESLLHSAAPP